ncbi:MAG: PIN domain-containing protein [Candidatus Dormibacteria bacterium]
MAVLVDTSILVASERGSIQLSELIRPDESYAISVVSAGELLHGVHRGDGPRAQARSAFVEGLLARFSTLPVDLAVARAYAHASALLSRAGGAVDANDLWIGATAIAHGMDVLALDGDFDRIPGVRRVGG